MRQTHDLLRMICGACCLPTGVEVARVCNRGNTENNRFGSMQSIILKTRTAIRLDMCVTEAFGKIINEERLEAVIRNREKEKF